MNTAAKVTLAVAALGFAAGVVLNQTMHTTRIDEDVILVTIDPLPDTVMVIKKGPDPVVHVTTKRVAPNPPARSPEAKSDKIVWTLPYSCSEVKWYHSHFTASQLEAMRVKAGFAPPSADQLRQIEACIHDRL